MVCLYVCVAKKKGGGVVKIFGRGEGQRSEGDEWAEAKITVKLRIEC